jgi:hypothetical protein
LKFKNLVKNLVRILSCIEADIVLQGAERDHLKQWVENVPWDRMPRACSPDVNLKGSWNPRQLERTQRKRDQVESFALPALSGRSRADAGDPRGVEQQPPNNIDVCAVPSEADDCGTRDKSRESAPLLSPSDGERERAPHWGARVRAVDFGSGSGNLLLPLGYLFPDIDFVAVDMKCEPIEILNARAHEAGLSNVRGLVGTIEAYTCGPAMHETLRCF